MKQKTKPKTHTDIPNMVSKIQLENHTTENRKGIIKKKTLIKKHLNKIETQNKKHVRTFLTGDQGCGFKPLSTSQPDQGSESGHHQLDHRI